MKKLILNIDLSAMESNMADADLLLTIMSKCGAWLNPSTNQWEIPADMPLFGAGLFAMLVKAKAAGALLSKTEGISGHYAAEVDALPQDTNGIAAVSKEKSGKFLVMLNDENWHEFAKATIISNSHNKLSRYIAEHYAELVENEL